MNNITEGKEPLSSSPQRRVQSKRLANINRIRQSMQNFTLIKQNHVMAEGRILGGTKNSSDDDQTGLSTTSNSSKNVVQHFQVFAQKYELLEKLGEGTHGVVHKCRKREDKNLFAVKSFAYQEQQLSSVKANFLVMKNLDHPNICKYQALYIDLKKRTGWLVMELIESPDLSKAALNTEDEKKRVIGQILDALNYLHKKDIVHRDIKGDNILYDPKTRKLKIIDFGIARRCKRKGQLFDLWTITGTLYYRAPEMFSGGYRQGVDIWSTGIMLYKMICGRTPFESEYQKDTIKNIQEGELKFPAQFDDYGLDIKDLLQRMLKKDPEERISAFACLRSPWVSSSSPFHLCRQGSIPQPEDELKLELFQCSTPLQRNRSQTLKTMNERNSRQIRNSLTSVRSYVKKVNGAEFHCIDSEW